MPVACLSYFLTTNDTANVSLALAIWFRARLIQLSATFVQFVSTKQQPGQYLTREWRPTSKILVPRHEPPFDVRCCSCDAQSRRCGGSNFDSKPFHRYRLLRKCFSRYACCLKAQKRLAASPQDPPSRLLWPRSVHGSTFSDQALRI